MRGGEASRGGGESFVVRVERPRGFGRRLRTVTGEEGLRFSRYEWLFPSSVSNSAVPQDLSFFGSDPDFILSLILLGERLRFSTRTCPPRPRSPDKDALSLLPPFPISDPSPLSFKKPPGPNIRALNTSSSTSLSELELASPASPPSV